MGSDPKWLTIASGYLGEREIAGARHNPRIVEWFARVGHGWVRDDETPWCAAFVGACLLEAGYPSTGKLNARSYLDYGEALDKPQRGCIAVFSRGDDAGWQGHVGFFLRDLGDQIEILSGNDRNSVAVGTYLKKRLLGYRWPTKAALPKAELTDIASIQRRLKDLGYHEVGAVDGIMGSRTRGALLAFKADNDLPLDASIDAETLRALFTTAGPRPVAPERQAATARELREQGSEEIRDADVIRAAAAVGVGGGAVVGGHETGALDAARDGVAEISALRVFVEGLQDLAGWMAQYWWVGALVVGFVAWRYGGRIMRAVTRAYRRGQTFWGAEG